SSTSPKEGNNLPRYGSGDYWKRPAVVAFPLGLVALPQPFQSHGKDDARIAVIATARAGIVNDRRGVFAVTGERFAADTTGLHRHHRARSVVCVWACSTARRRRRCSPAPTR